MRWLARLRKKIAKYLAILRIQVIDRMTYAGDLAIQSLQMVLFMWIFMQLWRTTYNAAGQVGSDGQSTIAGLTLNATLWYLMAAEVIMVSKPRLFRTISEAVKDGSVAYLLNKPYDFVLYHLSVGLGDMLMRMVFNTLTGGIIAWLLVGPPPDLWRGAPIFLLTALLAWLIDFFASTLIGLMAFYIEEVTPLDWIYSKLLLVLGGVLIPLDFFPEWLRQITMYLPFAYTIYGPAMLFIDPSAQRLLSVLTGQAIWIIVFGAVLTLVYRRGLAYLSVNGG